MSTAFIIGSPRSGTTVLGNILDCHRHIAEWYEPYYMWSFFIGSYEDDLWDPSFLTSRARDQIIKEYHRYKKKTGKELIVEKTPGHAFHIQLISKVFPEARWIHLIRDGRDATLSIRKEWKKRAAMVNNQSYRQLFETARTMLKRQPYLKYRLMALFYEFLSMRSLDPKMYLNKSKWKGKPYWGPRFRGWEAFIQEHTHLEFNAMQWVKSVEAVYDSWPLLPPQNRMEIRYEQLLTEPRRTLEKILHFLGQTPEEEFFAKIPVLKANNTHKWKTGFTKQEKEILKPILNPLLDRTGYLQTIPW